MLILELPHTAEFISLLSHDYLGGCKCIPLPAFVVLAKIDVLLQPGGFDVFGMIGVGQARMIEVQ